MATRNEPQLSKAILEKLKTRAREAGYTAEALLQQLLDTDPLDPEARSPLQQTELLHQVSDAVIAIDEQLRINFWNRAASQIYGYSEAEALGQTIDELLRTEWINNSHTEAQEILRASGQWQGEIRQHSKDGQTRHIWTCVNLIRSAGGRVTGSVMVNRDFTEILEARAALEEREKLLDALIEQSRDSIRIIDEQQRVIRWNPAAEQLSGISSAEALGLPFFEVALRMLPDDLRSEAMRRRLQDSIEASSARGERTGSATQEYRIQRPDGSQRFVETELFQFEAGSRRYTCAVTRDISDRKQAEAALSASEEKYRLIAENTSDGIMIIDAESTRVTYASPAIKQQLRIAPGESAELDAAGVYALIHPEDRDRVFESIYDALGQRVSTLAYSYRLRLPDNEYTWREDHARFIYDEKGGHVRTYVISRDIAERKKAEAALKESETRYRLLTESMAEYALSVHVSEDGNRRIEWVVGAFEAVTGYPPSIYDDPTRTIVHPEDAARVQADIARTVQGKRTTSEYRIIARDGRVVWLQVTRSPVWDEQQQRVVRFHSAVQNITERKEAEHIALEQERLKASLAKELEFNALIQRAISSLEHDVRTPLAVISTARDMLDLYYDRIDEEKRHEKLQAIQRQLQLLGRLLDELSWVMKSRLEYKRFNPTLVKLPALCQASLDEIRETIGGGHRFRLEAESSLQNAWLDETLVSRILLNLLSNAVKFSSKGSEITLTAQRQGEMIWLVVSDQGMGIPKEEQSDIFEPFYRGAAVENISGSGLGLSIVKDCVEHHHGRVWVESEIGAGTRFIVELPSAIPQSDDA